MKPRDLWWNFPAEPPAKHHRIDVPVTTLSGK